MRKLFISLCIGLTLLVSCKEEAKPLDACGCAKERFDKGLEGPNARYCDSLRHSNATFEEDFQKCYFSLNFGGDTAKSKFSAEQIATITGPGAGSYIVSAEKSRITWVGRETTGKTHTGSVKVKSGFVDIENKALKGGQIVIDMSTISNNDVDDATSKAKLEGHLHSADFFNTASFPEATFNIKSVQAKNSKEYVATGDLTIRGITHETTADVTVSSAGENKMAATAALIFDRSKYEVKFRSGKFETGLGDKMIDDNIMIHVTLQADKK
ncbi:MAG: hypothetical protein RL220_1056 [Bacteroidota bacterium]